MTKTASAGDPTFRHRAEERGYRLAALDEHGGTPELTGRPPAGVVFSNADGDSMWIPVEDLAVTGDLLIRAHVRVRIGL
jgi:hypothetical protein